MGSSPSSHRSPWVFFALVFVVAIPFWILGALTDQGLLTGLGIHLPFSALTFLSPAIAALILVYREEKLAGVGQFLRNVVDPRRVRPRLWYAPIFLLLPALYLLSYGVMRLMEIPLPQPQLAPVTLLILFAIFFVSAACEETGWTGYAIDPLQARRSALGAALILGVVWSVVHIVPDIQGHQTWGWIAGQRLFTVVLRILIVWLYNNAAKSVIAAIIAHTMDNVSVFALFPDNGDGHYIPAITAAITAIAAIVVTFLWRPRTLARFRFAR